MKTVRIIAGVAAALLAASCVINVGNGKTVRCKGPVVDKMMDLKDFKSITINGSSDIKLLQGESFLVSVHANEEVFDHLNYRVENGVLILETIDKVTIIADENEVTVALPLLTNITINGAADADMKGYTAREDLTIQVNGAGDLDFSSLTLPNLNIQVNGAGDIDLPSLDVDKLKVEVSGAGDVVASGKAGKAEFSVSGVGGIDARNLECEDFTTRKSGVASIRTPKDN